MKKSLYEYNACIMEPWMAPSIPFTDGNVMEHFLTEMACALSLPYKEGFVIMASGVDIKPEDVVQHGRLEPGKMFLVDMNAGRIIEDDEIKNK
jgi:glutamate synthase (ferredoxin)